jgi:hypothetical protein
MNSRNSRKTLRVHLQVLSGVFLKNKPTTEPTKEKELKAV